MPFCQTVVLPKAYSIVSNFIFFLTQLLHIIFILIFLASIERYSAEEVAGLIMNSAVDSKSDDPDVGDSDSQNTCSPTSSNVSKSEEELWEECSSTITPNRR